MACGLYGKLPAKRDFLALATPHAFLEAWEPWIQAGLATSRLGLGKDWSAAYLRAPIWRFWLGADIAGAVTLGAIMPSADGIGRYFPLTLVGRPPAEDGLPPEHEPFDGWFEIAEGFLLSTLSEDSFEAITAGLVALPDPVRSSLPPSTAGIARLGGALVGGVEGSDVPAAMRRLRPLAAAGLHAGMSYWWTAGGEGFPPRAACCRGLPDAAFYAALLTGRFDERYA
jgi:type VI secretion system protein ImpM